MTLFSRSPSSNAIAVWSGRISGNFPSFLCWLPCRRQTHQGNGISAAMEGPNPNTHYTLVHYSVAEQCFNWFAKTIRARLSSSRYVSHYYNRQGFGKHSEFATNTSQISSFSSLRLSRQNKINLYISVMLIILSIVIGMLAIHSKPYSMVVMSSWRTNKRMGWYPTVTFTGSPLPTSDPAIISINLL